MSVDIITGKVWKFGDDINTDLMLPNYVNNASEAEQVKVVFAANRPGWVDLVAPGDIIIGGKNFGTGSSRPAARSLRNLGIACLVAETINGLFLRNSVNFGLPALECGGVYDMFEEGHTAEISLETWTVRNLDTGAQLRALPIPAGLMKLMRGGGLYPVMAAQGLIAPRPQTGPAPLVRH
jgi:3-isopropylmalate/(R)-2-methylmalate dehydratase small subunit